MLGLEIGRFVGVVIISFIFICIFFMVCFSFFLFFVARGIGGFVEY